MSQRRYELTDFEWSIIAALLPNKPHGVERSESNGPERRLLEPIGNIPPAEAEARYYAMIEQSLMAA